jgi:hypothetical protein
MLSALWMGMTLYTEGFENAYGGFFASPVSTRAEARGASEVESRNAGPLTQRVRDRVTADLQDAARRHAGDVD